ncbi:redox-sensitive transcriptional activator SoxR [Vibrio cyclitrophicus]|jgi:MerR family redox-sensitive transcriptional activator SoxR|uniref:Redox-sensitive transcriptional activator SoxR n=2 Tax=Vibrio cyclitrophicus TaxID=47951 RepID=A0A7Z1MLV5_9VIBR|nr:MULTISPECIES: redox-sensitive transcriptional activator SoxR [Vibrio]MBE8607696.1 redox-sensitive transcriptional activator SoxR [Vibrio sp. OPT10]MCC4776363.1 redox-sensitive transcriptional activator SoxR [Vibrio cyclitrophicus]MCC4841498.1 redox-sensitive transcriptional activator SoxR [Vibrio cyclitrophicus]OBT27073.1 redox-sensitive transcriptional activator SoxR [Vibrio cyclitrophicus]OEE00250.1 redox-sensitive transcriptional activator SoxR [Vibrio cyclitrophicus ZF28]
MRNIVYLTIGQLSERSGVAPSALRFYETKGLIASIRTNGNQRRYQSAMLRRIALIQVAQSIGFTLEEITEELSTLPMNQTATKRDWERVAKKWQGQLDSKMSQLRSLQENLTGCIGCGCLSMQKCHLLNPEDILHDQGQGAQRIVD